MMDAMFEAFDDAILQVHGLTNDGTLALSDNAKVCMGDIESVFECFSNHVDVQKTTYKPTKIEVLTNEGGTIAVFLICGGKLATEAIFKARPKDEQALFAGAIEAPPNVEEGKVNESNCSDFSEDFDDICGQGSTQATLSLFPSGFDEVI